MGGKRYGIVKNPHWMKVAIQGSPEKKREILRWNPWIPNISMVGLRPKKNDQQSDGVTILDRMELAQQQESVG